MKKRLYIWKRAERGLWDVLEEEKERENIVIRTNNNNNKKQQENEVSGGQFSLHV